MIAECYITRALVDLYTEDGIREDNEWSFYTYRLF